MAACAALAGPVFAETYPAKPITVVVSYPPGGDTDAMARLFSEKLSARLKQTVVVDNRPGAGGTVGNTYVGRAAPDGYTLLFTPNPFSLAPLVMKLAPSSTYDVLNGFTPVIHSADQAVLLVANPTSGIKSVADLVAQAKSGKALSYGTPGAGSPMHIAGEWLNRSAGVKVQHVPYRGVAPAVTDVVAGHVQLAYVTLGPVAQYIATGKLVPLAISDPKRSPLLPNVPTLTESGVKNAEVYSWQALAAPKGLPAPVKAKIHAAAVDSLKDPAVAKQLTDQGFEIVANKPEEFSKFQQQELGRWKKVIETGKITAN